MNKPSSSGTKPDSSGYASTSGASDAQLLPPPSPRPTRNPYLSPFSAANLDLLHLPPAPGFNPKWRVYISVILPNKYEKDWYILDLTKEGNSADGNYIPDEVNPSFTDKSSFHGSATVFVGSIVYSIGGYSSSNTVTYSGLGRSVSWVDIAKFPKDTNRTEVEQLKRPRSGATAVLYKGKLFVFGGIHAKSQMPKSDRRMLCRTDLVGWAEFYDLETKKWTSTSAPPSILSDIDVNLTAVALEDMDMGRILLIGLEGSRTHHLYFYFPDTDSWEAAPPTVDEIALGRQGAAVIPAPTRTSFRSDAPEPRFKISNAIRCFDMVYWYYLGLYAYDLKEGKVLFTEIRGLEEHAGLRFSGEPKCSLFSDEQVENFLISLDNTLLCLVSMQENDLDFPQFWCSKFLVFKNQDNLDAFFSSADFFCPVRNKQTADSDWADEGGKIMSVNLKSWEDPIDDWWDDDEEDNNSVEAKDGGSEEVNDDVRSGALVEPMQIDRAAEEGTSTQIS